MPDPQSTLERVSAIESNPAGPVQEYNALIDAAYTSQMDGDHQKAITKYTKAIEVDPQVAGVYINRAAAYESIGDLDRALQDLDEALTLESKPEAITIAETFTSLKGTTTARSRTTTGHWSWFPTTRQLTTIAAIPTSTSQTMPAR